MASTKTYEPVGQCIYCCAGRDTKKLTDEHIVPFGLGGNLVLPRASCAKHAKHTSNIEGRALRSAFGPLRVYLGLPTRRPRDRPKTITYTTTRGDQTEHRELPPSKHPFVLAMWDFQKKPELLLGDRSDNLGAAWVDILGPDLFPNDGTKVTSSGVTDSNVISQLVAKIAHAYAATEFGHNHFRPLLIDLIFEQEKSKIISLTNKLVGGIENRQWPPASTNLHEISLEVRSINGRDLIVATIRLCAFLGAPVYEIVVGEDPIAEFSAKRAIIERR